MNSQYPHQPESCMNRRDMLSRMGTGLGMLGLAGVLGDENLLAAETQSAAQASSYQNPLAPKSPHFPAKAKHVIHLFMTGGPSHVDTFDPKPLLTKYDGKPLPGGENLRTERKTGAAMASPFKFQKYGESGIEVSELFQQTAKHIDDIAVIRSMQAEVPNHEPSLGLMNCGASVAVRPAFGSWLTYGMGTENQNLPGYMVMCPHGYPTKQTQNWQSAFLPGVYQGTYVDTRHTEVEKLIENVKNSKLSLEQQRHQIDLLQQMNQAHREQRGFDPALESRVQSFELAYRMQMEATDAFDVSREPKNVLEAYGDGIQARQILIARRLVERGVRFVQVFHDKGQPWDSHDDLEKSHRRLAGQCDQAISALISDLKRLGLFEETLILWGGEFGRTPTVELPKPGSNQGKVNGRDHNHYGFTCWLAGGGIKGGQVYGATDETGFKAVENPVHVHDLHATMLHALGFDHKKLTYRYAGRDYRLTDVHGNVVQQLLS
ncbi:DUF1501 domain-containing protein [Bremerella sp. JC770]|uniref:DUF1501 domain-containing protein n=1 Tax=Bremerella sp. JC770 TaxID=3232137 RepID=UPI00345B0BD5